MNIKRIIREESNDMEWIKDQDPSNIHIRNLEIGMVVMVECKNFFPSLKNREFTVDEITESYREGEICVHFKEMSKIKYPFGEDREPTIPGMNMCEHLGCNFKLISMNIKRIIREEIDDMQWIQDVNDPWENINPKLISQLTNEESDLIEDVFESEKREHGYYGCDPIYKITDLIFQENSDYLEEVVIPFEVRCEDGSNKGTSYITLWINRDTLEWDIA